MPCPLCGLCRLFLRSLFLFGMDVMQNSLGPPLPAEKNTLTLERYPSPYLPELKDQIAKFRGVRRDQIFLGVGSDEAIDILIRIFCQPQADTIMITPPTYGMYSVCAKVNDVRVQEVPLTPDFALDIDSMLKAVTRDTKIIFVCSPGNPTARSIPHADVVQLCNRVGCMVVLDEAYVDFSEQGSACKLLDQHSNLIVLQTMSKAFGLAGIRLGMALGAENLIQILNNVKAPYSVNKLTESVARSAFNNLDSFVAKVEKIESQKKIVMDALKQMPFVKKVHPSDTNFILFSVPGYAHQVYKRIADEGIVIRYRGSCLHCTDCLRMTVGTPDENIAFMKKLPEVYQAVVAESK